MRDVNPYLKATFREYPDMKQKLQTEMEKLRDMYLVADDEMRMIKLRQSLFNIISLRLTLEGSAPDIEPIFKSYMDLLDLEKRIGLSLFDTNLRSDEEEKDYCRYLCEKYADEPESYARKELELEIRRSLIHSRMYSKEGFLNLMDNLAAKNKERQKGQQDRKL